MPHVVALSVSCALVYLIFGQFLKAFRQAATGDAAKFGWLARTMTTNKPLYAVVAVATAAVLIGLVYLVSQS
jgi:hypothetical protein